MALPVTLHTLAMMAPESLDSIIACDPACVSFLSWAVLPDHLAQHLQRVGPLEASFPESESAPVDEQAYWSPDSPIVPREYPYNACEIYKHEACGSIYLVYDEWGGHVPERRARLVLRSLFSF